MLVVDKIQFQYPHQEILHDVSFSLNKGEIGTLIGASGSGKTTLFKLLTGLLPLQSGKLIIAEDGTPKGYHHIAYMCQEDLLLPWRTIFKNLTLFAELGKKPKLQPSLLARAKAILVEMGLAQCEEMFPHELSLGMKQRVSLARALLQDLPILLLDEPFASLDVALREQMYLILRDIQKKQKTTMLMVTHDFRDALSLSDRIFFLCEGTIKKTWEVSDFIRSDPEKSGKLLEEMRQTIINNFPF